MIATRLLPGFLVPAALALALLAAVPTLAGEGRIFRTVDEHGNVVFTDIPPREDDENAEQIIVETPNSFEVEEAIPAAQDQWIVEPEDAETEAPFRYDTLQIVSPADDEPVRENAGNVTIVTNVNPRLQSGHRMRLLMGGAVVQEGAQGSFSLTNVDRGTHRIALEIVDGEGNVLIRSPESTFHMLRVSIRRAG